MAACGVEVARSAHWLGLGLELEVCGGLDGLCFVLSFDAEGAWHWLLLLYFISFSMMKSRKRGGG